MPNDIAPQLASFAAGVIASIVGGYILNLAYRESQSHFARVKVVNRDEFYLLLNKAIKKAKNEIIQFGEGFTIDGLPDRQAAAEKYVKTIGTILKNNPNLKWRRIQTANPKDLQWTSMLKGLIDAYPLNFFTHVFDNTPGDHFLSIVLVDPDEPTAQVLLLVSQREFIDNGANPNIAKVGVLISGSPNLAQSLRQGLNTLRATDAATLLRPSPITIKFAYACGTDENEINLEFPIGTTLTAATHDKRLRDTVGRIPEPTKVLLNGENQTGSKLLANGDEISWNSSNGAPT